MPKSSAFFSQVSFSVNNEFTDISLLHDSENGYSKVYRAERHGKLHILKCLTEEAAADPRYQQLLQKEFEISFQLSHSGVVHTLGMEEVSGLGVCIIQEYIDGVTWDEFFNKVSGSERNRILIELCDALDYIHQHRIIHRDLKPQNILITRNGHHPCIIDFGLADKDSYVVLKEPAGTTDYASPEQQAPGILDNRSDIYSLGVIIDNIASANDFKLKKISRRCLENNPEKRFVSAHEISKMLKPFQWWRLWPVICLLLTGCLIAVVILREKPNSNSGKMQALQTKTEIQQKHISDLQDEIKQLSSELDSTKRTSHIIEKQQNSEVQLDNAILEAKKEMSGIARNCYHEMWNANSSLANDSATRAVYALNDAYKIDYQPYITSIMKKRGLDKVPNASSIRKSLIDEWYMTLYDYR